MQSLRDNSVGVEAPTKLTSGVYDKQAIAMEIDTLIQDHELSVLEACSWWLEERSIPETQFARYIPEQIIERLKSEAIEDGTLKPTLAKQNTNGNLDFLYDN